MIEKQFCFGGLLQVPSRVRVRVRVGWRAGGVSSLGDKLVLLADFPPMKLGQPAAKTCKAELL